MKDMVKWLAIGLGAYWVYETFFVTPVAPAAAAAGTAPADGSGGAAAPAAVGFNSLASIYTRMVQDAVQSIPGSTAASVSLTADGWNVYLKRQSSVTPPAPASVFGDSYTANPNMLLTPAQYWAVMEPFLVAQGMSGLGLYRGMGVFYRRRAYR